VPISLKELNNMESEVVIDMWGLGELTLRYRLDKYDDEALDMIDTALSSTNKKSIESWRKFILKVSTFWDMQDQYGNDLPLNEKSLERLHAKVIDKIASGIMGDRDPNLITKASSQASQEETSETS
jgi:hypothetical protein